MDLIGNRYAVMYGDEYYLRTTDLSRCAAGVVFAHVKFGAIRIHADAVGAENISA